MMPALLSCGELTLPNELVLLVIEHLNDCYVGPDYEALCNLALTCRQLQHLAEQVLYRRIELYTVTDLQHMIFAFDTRKERARAVQILKLQYQYRPSDLDGTLEDRRLFNKHVANMVDLRDWHIESPYDNFNWDKGTGGHDWVTGDMELFRSALEHACTHGPQEIERIQAERRLGVSVERQVGLAQLESLTIHSHGSHTDFWDLDGFHCLFRHPTLSHLHISCVAFPDDIPELHTIIRQTRLKNLTFDECVLSPKSLETILRTPAKLEHVTLGENVFNNRRSYRADPVLSKSPEASLNALSVVAHSLKTLVHHDPSWRSPSHDLNHLQRLPPKHEGLRNFHELQSIQCEETSFLYRATIINHRLAPPNLVELRLSRHWDTPHDFFDRLPDCQHYLSLPSLEKLELSQAIFLWDDMADPTYIADPDRCRARHAFGYKLFKAGINLHVTMNMHKSPGLIPPYLLGEKKPIHKIIYDASLVGIKRRISDEMLDDEGGTVTEVDEDGNEYVKKSSYFDHFSKTRSEAKDLPETDALGDADIHAMKSWVEGMMRACRMLLLRGRRPQGGLSHFFGADNGDFDNSDIWDEDDEDEDDMDGEMDVHLDEDFVDEEDMDELHEALMEEMMTDDDGNLYPNVDAAGTDGDDVDGSEEWADAPEDAATHPDLD